MGRNATTGTKQLNLEMSEDVLTAARAFAADRGETLRAVFEQAVQRHMACPPVLPQHQPLPLMSVAPPDEPPAKSAKGKGKKK